MRLEFAKHIERVDLGEYMPEMAGQVLFVWVNPSMGQRVDYLRALRDASSPEGEDAQQQVYALTAELLSQGPEESRWTADEIKNLLAESAQTDPRFWSWLIERIVVLIETHRGNVKKN